MKISNNKLLIVSSDILFLEGTKYELEEDGITADISETYIQGYECYALDTDLSDIPDQIGENAKIIRLSRDKICDLQIPFHINELEQKLGIKPQRLFFIGQEEKDDKPKEQLPKLTECEKKILEMLVGRSPECVNKEELFRAVFKKTEKGTNVVNVYINSLRKKIEKDGKKVILTDRNKGFRIDSVTQFLVELLRQP